MIEEKDTRNKIVEKPCAFCGAPALVEECESNPLCDDHKGAGL